MTLMGARRTQGVTPLGSASDLILLRYNGFLGFDHKEAHLALAGKRPFEEAPMALAISTTEDMNRLRHLRKKRLWRPLIELGNRLLTQPVQVRAVRVHAELGKAYIEVRQYEAAREHLQAARELQPRNAVVMRRFGELECAVGNYEAAVRYWQSLKKKKAERADGALFLNLARAQRNLGQLDAASMTVSEGCTRYPNNPKLTKELQTIASMLDDQAEARDVQTATRAVDHTHPYRGLDAANYWNKTVSPRNPLEIVNWYTRKFSITGSSISSAGSCFAQHIGRALRENGCEYVDVEPAPNFLRPESHHDYGYGIYSARFGNVYTSRQLLQLVQRSLGLFDPKDSVWEKDGGYVDAFRPTIEPEPFDRPEEVLESRKSHLAAIERMFRLSNVFIFTMGLTETWMSNGDGAVYPVAPGVSGGKYDPAAYSFKNLTYPEVLEDMEEFIRLIRNINRTVRIILTVSPVPLMATATSNNVVVASSYSKSVLRSVAGHLQEQYEFIDYFPSYEIVGSHIMRGQFFNPDGRTVSLYGVSHVMKQFFAEHVPPAAVVAEEPGGTEPDDVVCDEELLNEFGPS
jgi:tetratricopeptide (TPR) repeat protein